VIPRTGGNGATIASPAGDDFERAALGADWTVHLGNAAIVGASDWGASAFSGIHIASWTATTVGDDQVVEATLAAGWDNQLLAQPYVRRRSADAARYGFGYDDDPAFAAVPRWYIKYDGVPTEQTRYLVEVTGLPAAVPGDRLRLEVRGSNPVLLAGYRNGILVVEAADSNADRVTSGTPGLVARAWSGSSLTYPQPVFADFAVGTLL